MLAKKNPHERDEHISFDEGPHIYTIDGESDFMSVTTWNHSHFAEFNADVIITNMMNGKIGRKISITRIDSRGNQGAMGGESRRGRLAN